MHTFRQSSPRNVSVTILFLTYTEYLPSLRLPLNFHLFYKAKTVKVGFFSIFNFAIQLKFLSEFRPVFPSCKAVRLKLRNKGLLVSLVLVKTSHILFYYCIGVELF